MPSNIHKTLVIGGMMVFGFLAGGKLGSLLGTALGAYFCQMLDAEGPVDENPNHQFRSDSSHYNSATSGRKVRKDKPYESLSCTICLEPFKPAILLLPCSHMCYCDDCFETARETISFCPLCRQPIQEFKKLVNNL